MRLGSENVERCLIYRVVDCRSWARLWLGTRWKGSMSGAPFSWLPRLKSAGFNDPASLRMLWFVFLDSCCSNQLKVTSSADCFLLNLIRFKFLWRIIFHALYNLPHDPCSCDRVFCPLNSIVVLKCFFLSINKIRGLSTGAQIYTGNLLLALHNTCVFCP